MTKQVSPNQPEPPGCGPRGEFDVVAFGDALVEAALVRRRKTELFITEERLEAILADCMSIRKQRRTRQANQILVRMLDNTDYLAVAGNWHEFLEMLGLSQQDWNEDQEGDVSGA